MTYEEQKRISSEIVSHAIADGSMNGNARDYWDGQGGRELGAREMKDTLHLSPEQMRALATALVTSNRYF